MTRAQDGTILWSPSEELKRHNTLAAYMTWLAGSRGLEFETYDALWQWSVTDLDGFWGSLWDYFAIDASRPYVDVVGERTMPGARWFAGAELNYAQHVFRMKQSHAAAVLFQSEHMGLTEIEWQDLEDDVASMAAALEDMGVGLGDRVVAYMPNIPQTLVAFLACASIGAIWSSCSPDFGVRTVTDRFAQITPKVLIAADGYRYNGRVFSRLNQVADLQQALPGLERTILVPYVDVDPALEGLRNVALWADALAQHRGSMLRFAQVPFDHPLWVLYSSGTTGVPKAIVQGHGGILLEHLKALGIHSNLRAGDRFFWYSTTGWMMWNLLMSGLLVGATVLMYDGGAAYPDIGALWRFAARAGANLFGTRAGFISACMNAGIHPGRECDLSSVTAVHSTGSPLSSEGFEWVYDHVKSDLWLASMSGGTDVCSAFVGGCPMMPVRAGEIQCRLLGVKVEAFDPSGKSIVGQVGELVVTEPLPSMPLYFWNDPDMTRYRGSYFSMYPGVWRHGDWIKITPRGSCIIYGRADSTINRQGVRMGTSEIYRVVEDMADVVDSLVVDLESLGRSSYMALFLVLREGTDLDDDLTRKINKRIRDDISPRHVPDQMFAIDEVPRTLNGKKLEVPVRKILMGTPVTQAVSEDAIANPKSLEFFVQLAARLNAGSNRPDSGG